MENKEKIKEKEKQKEKVKEKEKEKEKENKEENEKSNEKENSQKISTKPEKRKREKKEPYIPIDLDKLKENIEKDIKEKFTFAPEDVERLLKLQKYEDGLTNGVNNLGITIQNILDKQYEEYVKTFIKFMDNVREEIRKRIEEIENETKKKLKENDIRIVKCERDFFRLEAIRLNGLCKDMSSKIEEMGFRMKLLTNELNNMTIKWKESENINKQLLVELESNIQSMKDVERENGEMKEKINKIEENENNIESNIERKNVINENEENNVNYNVNNNNFDDNNLIDYNNNYNNENEVNNNILIEQAKNEKLYEFIERLKNDLRKERLRNHKTLSEFNKMIIDKNKLETIFSDCVEEVRKNIFNRKLKDAVKDNTKYKKNQDLLNIPYVSNIKFNQFLPADKRKIIEIFVTNDEVTNIIKNIIFNKSNEEIENHMDMEGINILNENRIQVPEKTVSAFKDTKAKTKTNFFVKSSYNFANSFGQKTMLNFGTKNKFKPFKPVF